MLEHLHSALKRHLPRQLPLQLSLSGGARRGAAGGWWRHEAAIMGTSITVDLWAEDKGLAAHAAAAVMRVMRRIDEAMSPHKAGSELSRINRDAARAPVLVSDEMFCLLRRALEFSALTEGAFDITYAGAGRLYDFRAGVAPDEAALAAALPGIGWRHVELDEVTQCVRFAHPATRIDLGGFAKGHAVDQAASWLRRLGIAHAYVSAGGDSRVIGDRRGRPWTLGIRDPRAAGKLVAVLPLEDVSVSTSGDYERCFMREGERVHHLLDPATGRPARGASSVTVLAPDGLTAEALSKAVFVRGTAWGLALIERVAGADAVVVDTQGRLHRTSGLLGDELPEAPR
jgi:thiamine biosynthesis lipoprotein